MINNLEFKNFLLPEFQFRQNRQLIFDFKIPYDLVAQGNQNDQQNLTFPNWWRIMDIARTHFRAVADGADFPPKIKPEF